MPRQCFALITACAEREERREGLAKLLLQVFFNQGPTVLERCVDRGILIVLNDIGNARETDTCKRWHRMRFQDNRAFCAHLAINEAAAALLTS